MVKIRMQVLNDTMNEMFGYLRENGQVGILDGSNTSHAIREYITGKIAQEVRTLRHQYVVCLITSPMFTFLCGLKCV